MKKIQLNKIIKVCPDCGFEIISFVSDDEPIVMSDDINGVFVLCPKCGDYVPIIEMPEIDENDKSDIIFTLEDCKYDLEEHEKRIIESKLKIKLHVRFIKIHLVFTIFCICVLQMLFNSNIRGVLFHYTNIGNKSCSVES